MSTYTVYWMQTPNSYTCLRQCEVDASDEDEAKTLARDWWMHDYPAEVDGAALEVEALAEEGGAMKNKAERIEV
jgi:hypothetical protein